MSNLCAGILRDRNVEDVWPLTDQATAEFWSSLGFRKTEEIDEQTSHKMMVKSETARVDKGRAKILHRKTFISCAMIIKD